MVTGTEKLSQPLVAVFSGPPATGKSTLADAIGRELPAPVFAWDWLVAALTPFEPVQRALKAMSRDAYHDVGYSLMTQLVEKQLRSGQSALLDCVARERARSRWAQTAAAHDATMRVIECVCSDVDVHRSRVDGRVRAIPGWDELDWEHVEHVRSIYEPLECEKLVVDAVEPIAENLARVRRHLGLSDDSEEQREER